METQAENPSLNQETASLLRSNRELAVLYTIAGHLNRKIDVHEALQEVLAQVTNLLGLQTGWVWLLDQQGEPYLAAAQALPPYLADHPQRMTGYCLCLDTFLEGCLEGAANIDVFRCSRLKHAERDKDPTLAQGLAAISLQLETADALAASRPERAHEAIRRALSLARSNLEEARRSVMDLRAAPLQNRTLPEALAALAQHSCTDPTVDMQYSYSPAGDFPALPARLEEGIYRIAQEALANACKHARAQHIDVTLTVEDQYLHFMVQDDGCGFDPDKVTGIGSEGHFGLIGMAERVKLLGGSICVSSEPGAGTCIAVRVPYN